MDDSSEKIKKSYIQLMTMMIFCNSHKLQIESKYN